jgi:hypothetical protein
MGRGHFRCPFFHLIFRSCVGGGGVHGAECFTATVIPCFVVGWLVNSLTALPVSRLYRRFVVSEHGHSRRTFNLNFQCQTSDENSTFHRNVGVHLPYYTVSQPKRLQFIFYNIHDHRS